jgi:hypothetical protein
MPIEQGYGGGTGWTAEQKKNAATRARAECGEVYPVHAFYRDGRRRDGINPKCRDCYHKSKPCRTCGETKGVDGYYPNGAKPTARCKECVMSSRRDYRRDNRALIMEQRAARRNGHTPDQKRDGALWSNYRIRLSGVRDILARQGGGCAVCGRPEPGTQRWWHVDHDHSCCPGKRACGACIRGILCQRCNLLLGQAQDSIATLQSAIEYLGVTRAD